MTKETKKATKRELRKKILRRMEICDICHIYSPQIRGRKVKGTSSLYRFSKRMLNNLLADKEVKVKGGNNRFPSIIFYKEVQQGDLKVEVPLVKLF